MGFRGALVELCAKEKIVLNWGPWAIDVVRMYNFIYIELFLDESRFAGGGFGVKHEKFENFVKKKLFR